MKSHIGQNLGGSQCGASMPFPMESGCITVPAQQCIYQSESCTELQWSRVFIGVLVTWLNLISSPFLPQEGGADIMCLKAPTV